MLNTKKLLTKILKRIKAYDDMRTPYWTKSVTLSAGASTAISLPFADADIDLTNYRVLTLNTISFTGTNAEYIVLRGFVVSNGTSTLSIYVKSTASSSTITFNVVAYGLALKTN